jgi:hypothetical protein
VAAAGGVAGAGAGEAQVAGETGETGEAGALGGRGGGGGFGFGGRGGGAAMLVDPGEYTITLAMAGKTDSKTAAVSEDPRVTFSAEDRARRKAAVDRLIAMAKEADTGRRKIVAMQIALTNLIDSWKRPAAPPVPDSIKKATDEMLAKVKAALPPFEMEPSDGPVILGFAGAPLKYTPPPVNQQITRLLGSIANYPGAPTSKQLIDIDQCGAELKQGLAEVGKLDGDIPKLNKMMAEAGIPYVTIDTTNVHAPAGGRGGGN